MQIDREKTINGLERLKKFAKKYDMPGIEKTTKSAIKLLKEKKPAQIELEGGGSTWWYVCEECHGAVDGSDNYCKHCGRQLINQTLAEIMKKNKLAEEWTESEFGINRSD